MDFNNIPKELKQLQQWVCWGVDKQNPKKPFNPNNLTSAKAGDSSTWGSFEQAVQRVSAKEAQGIGFEFNDNGIVGIDLDHCIIPETGEIKDWAAEILQTLNSYTEISMSKTGIHIFIKGHKSGTQCKKLFNKETGEAIEIYEKGRYFAMTGNNYNDKSITERTEELKTISDKTWSEESPTQNLVESSQTPDYYIAIGLEKDKKLKALWNGQRDSSDESASDMALMCKLAYWCNCDKESMIRVFSDSPFAAQKDEAHKKKLQRKDYLSRTADAAIASCKSTAEKKDAQFRQNKKNPKSSVPEKVKGMKIVSAFDLQKAKLSPIKYLIDDLLPVGTSMLAAAPKSGKSWMVLLMGLKIAAGEPFLYWQTKPVGVLYLAFEDNWNRLQMRMNKVLDNKQPPEWFYYFTDVINLDNGLLDSLDETLKEHPEIKLVIIDTFQKIRGQGLHSERWYSHDYREAGMIKEYIDKKGISVLLVHHTNKTKDKSDPFNEIAGTNGIFGAMDTMFLLQKDSRNTKQAKLHVTGRDIEQKEIVMSFNEKNCQWCFVGDAEELERQEAESEYRISFIVGTIKKVLDESPNKRWTGNAKKLLEAGERFFKIPIAQTPQSLSKELRKFKDMLFEKDRIVYTTSPNGNAGYRHNFRYDTEVGLDVIESDTEEDDFNVEF